ncbi:metal-sensing transcriptional repressor [Paraburkholderia ultramafica]|nr:metal-sensing transcriptional repressor [Paraburkholderia ultramafica]
MQTSHQHIVKWLQRAEGHLKSVIAMVGKGRTCVDIAQQVQAVESAICNARTTLVREHIDHCLEQPGSQDAQSTAAVMSQLKAVTKYL